MDIQLAVITDALLNGMENGECEWMLACLQNAGFNVYLTYLSSKKQIDEQLSLIDKNAKIYGILVYVDFVDQIIALIERIKKQENIVFIFGSFASRCYRELIEEIPLVDFVLVGYESNDFVNGLAAVIDNGSIKFLQDLSCIYTKGKDVTPAFKPIMNMLITRERIINYPEQSVYIVDSRGCAYSCSFCAYASIKSKCLKNDVQAVVRQLCYLHTQTKYRSIIFTGSALEGADKRKKAWISHFLRELSKYDFNFSYRCYVRADAFRNTDYDRILLSSMVKEGFTHIFVGIDAANKKDLALYKKGYSVEDAQVCINMLRQAGLEVMLGFIMFNPYSTIETVRSNYEFLKTNNEWQLNHYISKTYIYKYTALYHMLLKDGLLSDQYTYQKLGPYYFINNNIHKTVDAISVNLVADNYFNQLIKKLREFVYYYRSQLANTTLHEKEEVNYILKCVADSCIRCFEPLYVETDINAFIANIPYFKNEIEELCNAMWSIKFRLLKRRNGLI